MAVSVSRVAERAKLQFLGSGKTMLMDMFFNEVQLKQKERHHFNEFMLTFHSSN